MPRLAIAQGARPPDARFTQWLASLLLGTLNIEQTKFLNWDDMAQLLGWVVRFPHPQRQELERLATQESFQGLACFNARGLGAGEQSDFIHTAAFRTDKLCVRILARFLSRFCSIVWYDGSNKAPRTGKTGH